MEIKDRIKEVRKTIGITQGKFAGRIAISTSYLSEVENGLKEVNERAIRLIVAEFNVNNDWLRYGKGTMFKEDVSASVSEAMLMFKALDKHYQDGALKMLAALNEVNRKEKAAARKAAAQKEKKE